MDWEECVPFKEGKVEHLFRKIPLQCIPCCSAGLHWKEREGPSRELGEMFYTADSFVAAGLNVRPGCVKLKIICLKH